MCSKVLFVLLVVIIVLAIIIFIIHNCKKETFDLGESIDNLVDGALGSVSDTMNELDDNDALIDIEYNNAPIYINTDGDLHAYDKNDSHHSSEITSGDAVSKHDYIHHIRRKGHKRRHHHHHHESHHHKHKSHHHNRGGGGSNRGGGGSNSGGSVNPPCIDCKDPNQNLNYKNVKNKCECNGEKKCSNCDNCTWCTSTGLCTPNNKLPNDCNKKPKPTPKSDK